MCSWRYDYCVPIYHPWSSRKPLAMRVFTRPSPRTSRSVTRRSQACESTDERDLSSRRALTGVSNSLWYSSRIARGSDERMDGRVRVFSHLDSVQCRDEGSGSTSDCRAGCATTSEAGAHVAIGVFTQHWAMSVAVHHESPRGHSAVRGLR